VVASKDHLSYYTYYKTAAGDTTAGVAARFGLAESSLVRMNPYLTQYGGNLPPGTLVCVPREQTRSSTGLLARSERIAAAKAKAEAEEKAAELAAAEEARSAKKTGKSKKSKKKAEPKPEETEWPSEDEWEKLAELCTKGAPPPPAHSSMVIEAPPSRFIGADGQVTWIPAAKPQVVKPRKAIADTSRGELASRKGKAIHTVVMTGRSYMGVPYVWGGEDPSGFDCSGFIQYVYGKHGIHLPRTADIQYNVGKVVKRGDEKPGDLVFFETYCPGPSHVGIYLGRDYFLHASSSRGVTTDRLSSDFFAQRYLGAKRNF
jgi:cell wall-associated NlpC family hydrolase